MNDIRQERDVTCFDATNRADVVRRPDSADVVAGSDLGAGDAGVPVQRPDR
jgi:hypothetical protein